MPKDQRKELRGKPHSSVNDREKEVDKDIHSVIRLKKSRSSALSMQWKELFNSLSLLLEDHLPSAVNGVSAKASSHYHTSKDFTQRDSFPLLAGASHLQLILTHLKFEWHYFSSVKCLWVPLADLTLPTHNHCLLVLLCRVFQFEAAVLKISQAKPEEPKSNNQSNTPLFLASGAGHMTQFWEVEDEKSHWKFLRETVLFLKKTLCCLLAGPELHN